MSNHRDYAVHHPVELFRKDFIIFSKAFAALVKYFVSVKTLLQKTSGNNSVRRFSAPIALHLVNIAQLLQS
jgi:hypothetical protein